jgi:hypothetical protein
MESTMEDCYGLPISLGGPESIDALNQYTHALISQCNDEINMQDLAQQHPHSLLIQCHSAATCLIKQNDASQVQAKLLLEYASRHLDTANHREKLYYQAILAWSQLNYELAVLLLIAITRQWPKDMVAALYAQKIFYYAGIKHNAARFLTLCRYMEEHNECNPHFLGMYSYALALCDHQGQAASTARKALAIEIKTPSAHQTLAYLYLINAEDDRTEELRAFQPCWTNMNSEVQARNTLRIGLFAIAQRNEKEAVQLYQEAMPHRAAIHSLEQYKGIAYLWRMDLAGMPQQAHWNDLLGDSTTLPTQFYYPLQPILYTYALMQQGQESQAQALLEHIEQYSQKLSALHSPWQHHATRIMKAIIAFHHKDYEQAATLLTPLLRTIDCIGGSDLDLEVVVQMSYLACLYSQQQDKAHKVAMHMLSHYQPTPLGHYWLEQVKQRSCL